MAQRRSRLPAIPFAKLFRLRRWLPGALAVAAGLTGPVDRAAAQPPVPLLSAQPAAQPPMMPAPGTPGALVPVAPPKGTDAPVAQPGGKKTVKIHYELAPWGDVLEWYAKETGLTMITTVKPTGSVTIKPGKDREFTIGEVTDLLNETMAQQKFLLIRRNMTFFIHPADEKIDPTLIPRIAIDQLPERGRTEIVQTILPIKGMVVADAQEELRRLLTPFGTMVTLEKPNAILITDTVGNIVRIQKTLEEIEKENSGSDSLDHVCKYRRAQEVAEQIKTLMTDKDVAVTVTGAQAPMQFTDPQQFGGRFGGFDRGSSGFNPGGFGPNRGNTPAPTGARVKNVQIAVDARRNAILVTAPQDKIGLARDLIQKQDKPLYEGQKPFVPADPVFKTYSVAPGSAVELAKVIQGRMAWVQAVPLAQQNQLMVLCTPEDHFDVVKILGLGEPGGAATTTEIIPLSFLDPADTAALLVKLFPTPAAGGPTIEVQKDPQPGLVVKATSAQILEIKDLLIKKGEKIGAGGAANFGGSRTIDLGNGNASVFAEQLAKMLDAMGKKSVVLDPLNPQKPKPPVLPRTNIPPAPPPGPPTMKQPGAFNNNLRDMVPGRDFALVAAQIVDPEKKDDKPVTIFVQGGKLTIQCDDPKVMEVISQLVRLYTVKPNDPAAENLFKVIPLKYVSAEDAAREITEIFNGPQQQQRGGGAPGGGGGRGGGGGGGLGALFGGGGGLLGGLLGGGGGGDTSATPNRVRVVAEKSSNSLIVVKATPIDLLTIEKLLASAIDGGQNDSAAVMKTFVLPIKNADASEMATVVRDVFRSAMSSTGGGGGQTGGLPFLPFLPQQQQGGGTQRPPALSLSVDDRSNSLVLLCAETLYDDIKTLVTQLDDATVSTTEVVKLVKLKGVDPAMVQQAIAAVQGRDTRQQQGGFGNRGGGQGGFGGQGGGLGGGGNPFGGGQGGFGGGNPFGGGQGGFGGVGGGRGGGGGIGGGGGGTRGGGGGTRGGGGGGGRVGLGPTQEGPRTFNYRGTDAPSAAFKLYDPQTDAPDLGYNRPGQSATSRRLNDIVQIGAAQPPVIPGAQPPKMPDPMTPPGYAGPDITFTAPRGTVTAIPIQGLDSVVIRASDAKDLEIVLEIIRQLAEVAKGTEPKLEVVYLDHGDCNYIATTLNAIFARVTIGQDGNYVPASARNTQNAALTQLAGASPTQNVYCVALPRVNGILIAAPAARMDDIKKEMRKLLDVPNSAPIKAYKLKKASAQLVASQLQNFWNTRFPGEALTQNQFRVTFDIPNNTVFVQGSNADLKDVETLIEQMDASGSRAINNMRVFYLKNALADELGQILSNSLTANIISPIAQAQQTGPVAQAAGGAAQFLQGTGQTLQQQPGGQQLQQLQQGLGQQGQQGLQGLQGQQNQNAAARVTPINAIIPTIGFGTSGGLATKSNAIRFFSAKDGKVYETGYLEDVHIVSSARINALIVSAPEPTMVLIERLVENLDTVSAARSYVNVFQLKKGMDATLTANLISQMFTGQGRTANQNAGQNQLNQQTARPLLTITGNPSDGASLIDLRISVDDRTNSLIVAGSLNDLDTIRTVIGRMEGFDGTNRTREVIKLRNAAAADVTNAIQQFYTNALTAYTGSGYTSVYQQLLRNVQVIAEPVSNTVLIDASVEYFPEIRRIIDRIDAQPPQVVIQVTIANVQLTNQDELGVEVGLQSPVIFDRGAGLNFNTTAALPNNNVGTGIVGFSGLQTLGVGRASPNTGVGGFVFSASSDTFSLLVRALKAQGRIETLSRPQIQVADNQTGFVQVGQSFPTVTTSNATLGTVAQNIEYRNIGITMRVTPRVNPDGKILMRVEPLVSSLAGQINLGGGILAPAFNVQTVQTTVLASDGETIVLGGLIANSDNRQETGIPYLKDIPYAGALFRYRTRQQQRQEVLIIMTPHIVRSELDNARILAEESAKMRWCLPDVVKTHGHGGEVMFPAAQGARPVPVNPQPAAPIGPAYFEPAPGAPPAAQPMPMVPTQPTYAPQPQPAYVPQAQPQPGAFVPPQPAAPQPVFVPAAPPAPALPGAPVSAAPSGVIPVSVSQPLFAQPQPQPAAPQQPVLPVGYVPQPVAPPVLPTAPVAAQPAAPVAPKTSFVMSGPGAPAGGGAVVPVAPGRSFGMSAPASAGKAAPTPEQAPSTKTTEGGLWNGSIVR